MFSRLRRALVRGLVYAAAGYAAGYVIGDMATFLFGLDVPNNVPESSQSFAQALASGLALGSLGVGAIGGFFFGPRPSPWAKLKEATFGAQAACCPCEPATGERKKP